MQKKFTKKEKQKQQQGEHIRVRVESVTHKKTFNTCISGVESDK